MDISSKLDGNLLCNQCKITFKTDSYLKTNGCRHHFCEACIADIVTGEHLVGNMDCVKCPIDKIESSQLNKYNIETENLMESMEIVSFVDETTYYKVNFYRSKLHDFIKFALKVVIRIDKMIISENMFHKFENKTILNFIENIDGEDIDYLNSAFRKVKLKVSNWKSVSKIKNFKSEYQLIVMVMDDLLCILNIYQSLFVTKGNPDINIETIDKMNKNFKRLKAGKVKDIFDLIRRELLDSTIFVSRGEFFYRGDDFVDINSSFRKWGNNDCVVCLEDVVSSGVKFDDCSHKVCCRCMQNWVVTCGICPIDGRKRCNLIMSDNNFEMTAIDYFKQYPSSILKEPLQTYFDELDCSFVRLHEFLKILLSVKFAFKKFTNKFYDEDCEQDSEYEDKSESASDEHFDLYNRKDYNKYYVKHVKKLENGLMGDFVKGPEFPQTEIDEKYGRLLALALYVQGNLMENNVILKGLDAAIDKLSKFIEIDRILHNIEKLFGNLEVILRNSMRNMGREKFNSKNFFKQKGNWYSRIKLFNEEIKRLSEILKFKIEKCEETKKFVPVVRFFYEVAVNIRYKCQTVEMTCDRQEDESSCSYNHEPVEYHHFYDIEDDNDEDEDDNYEDDDDNDEDDDDNDGDDNNHFIFENYDNYSVCDADYWNEYMSWKAT